LTVDGDAAVYVDDVLPAPASDSDIWALAARDGLVIVSKDVDFASRAVRENSVWVVWVRCGNLKLKTFEVWLIARRVGMRRLLEAGECLVELR
jgi:predicted nuclease of predicted toxin-antitoxin system